MNKVVFKDGHTEDILSLSIFNSPFYDGECKCIHFTTVSGVYVYQETIKQSGVVRDYKFLGTGMTKFASHSDTKLKVIYTIDHIELEQDDIEKETKENTIDSKKGECGSMTGEREESYLDIQRRVAGIFYNCAAFNDIDDDFIHLFYEDIHDCVKKAWQLGIHQERMRQVHSEIKKGGNE